jgi:putative DNA primase/helicase
MSGPKARDSHKPRKAAGLGSNVSKSAKRTDSQNTKAAKAVKKLTSVAAMEVNGPFKLIDGFGLYFVNDGRSSLLCPLIHVKGYVVDANGQHPAYLVVFKNYLEQQVTVALPLATLNPPEQMFKLLTGLGFAIDQNNIKNRSEALKQYLELNCQVTTTFVRAASDGWMTLPNGEKVYVYGDDVLGTNSGTFKAVRLSNVTANLNRRGGSADWHALLKSLRHDHMAVLAVCAALSAPLLEPLNFGTLALFFVGLSSIGKTILLKLVAAIFDSPDDLLTWEGTENGIEAHAQQRKDKPLVTDEVSQAKACQFSALSYRLTNPASKQRATSTGKAVAVQQTRTVIVSSGEVSPIELMADAGVQVRQGQVARLVSIPVNQAHGVWSILGVHQTGADKSNHILRQLQGVHGIAGKQFCKKTAANIDVYAPTFFAIAQDLADEICPDVDSQSGDGVPARVLQNFALFAFAGLLAVEHQTVPWNEKNVMDAVTHGYSLWLADYKARQPVQDAALIAPVRLFFQSQRSSKFKPLDTWRDNHDGAVAGYEHVKRNGERFFLAYPAYFEQHLCGEHSPKAVLAALRKAGYLAEGPRGVPTQQVHLPGSDKKSASFYFIRQTILHD